ncbi:MAG: tRNA (adenosine(37)-N6)-dimethylallyltransferase MiaA [Candidatus Limnocylindrales bacterium]
MSEAATAASLPSLLVLVGPTATGKTGLALALAEALAGSGVEIEILSADSRQVFRGMDIGTAKATAADRARVPHHGLDLVDPDELFNAADFQRYAYEVLPGIAARGRLAMLVGGTGLYVRTVARGLPLDTGQADPGLRVELEARLAADGLQALAAELRRTAPVIAASTDLANSRRVVRALERARLVGDRLPEPPRGYPAPVTWLGLALHPAENRRRIVERANAQFQAGLEAEAVGLRTRFGVHPRAFSAFGYYEALALADGVITREEALRRTIDRTAGYARRQRTWFRTEAGISWLEAAADPLPAALAATHRLLALS